MRTTSINFLLALAWVLSLPAIVCGQTEQPTGSAIQSTVESDGTGIAPKPRKPNIVYILADDLGYGDLGCYGQREIQTPSLDSLALRGLRFTRHYSGSTVCAPSRCCLLTGRHTGHVPIRGNTPALLGPGDVTVGKLLKQAGYATAIIGKWGVGDPPPPGDPARNGFETFFGYLDMRHAHNHYPDFLWHNGAKTAVSGNVVKAVRRGGVAIKRSQYSHDLFTDQALSYIEAQNDRPFFLYLAFTIPHANNEAGSDGMEVPDAGIYRDRDWPEPQINHAAMITRLDESVGKVVALLEKLELDRETLILFSSDNGPHKEGGADPAFFNSSGGLRGYKRDLYEGGIRVPLIAYWPGTIEPKRVSDHPSTFWDFLPTAADVAGIEHPAEIDGISFLPTLLGNDEGQQSHAYMYWEFQERGPQQAVRMGKWKFHRHGNQPLELYDLETDPFEERNVAAQNPAVIKSIEFYLLTARTPHPQFIFPAESDDD